jgi:hypothetical protein
MKKNCEYCGKEFDAERKTARFDSPTCRKAYGRVKAQDSIPNEQPMELERADEPLKISKEALKDIKEISEMEYDLKGVDKEFYEMRTRRGFECRFGKERHKECMHCKKKFTTRLHLMKFCSFKCHPIYEKYV